MMVVPFCEMNWKSAFFQEERIRLSKKLLGSKGISPLWGSGAKPPIHAPSPLGRGRRFAQKFPKNVYLVSKREQKCNISKKILFFACGFQAVVL